MLKTLIEKNHLSKLQTDMGLFSDHLPMVLQALTNMKAKPERLSAFAESKFSEKQVIPDVSKFAINHSNWKQFLGKRERPSGYISFFQHELDYNGLQPTLDVYLPTMVTGMGSAAFHGLIRLAYALELDIKSEIAHALAAWACTHRFLGELPPSGKYRLSDSYNRVRQANLFDSTEMEGDNIIQKMVFASKHPLFQELVGALDRSTIDISDIANVAIILYLSSDGNFTAIHGVTATHALRVLLKYMTQDTQKIAIGYFWQALLAAIISIKSPELRNPDVFKNDQEWDDLFALACASDDNHVIKFVYSCYCESKAYPTNKLYLFAANKKATGVL